jgi:hypothetical protein
MQARQMSELPVRPFELSLRVRHPSLDPAEISRSLELEPEHCFKAGDPRGAGERPGTHAQTYWRTPIDTDSLRQGEPSFLQDFEAQFLSDRGISADRIAAVSRSFRQAGEQHGSCQLEGLLFALLARLNLRQEFLARIQNEGGDVSVLVVADPAALRNFNLNVPITRFLAKLNIEVEFEFETGG